MNNTKVEISDELRERIEAKKKTHIFYDEWCEWFIGLNPADVAELAKGIAYMLRGTDYNSTSVTANTLLKIAKPLIDANRGAYIDKVARQIDGINKRWEKEKNKSANSQVIVDYKSANSQGIVKDTDIELELDIDSELKRDIDYPTGLLKDIIPSDKGLKKKDTIVSQKEGRIPKITLDEFIARWNTLPSPIPKVTVLKPGSKRYDSLAARIDEYGEDKLMMAVELIRQSSFLCGKSSTWHISLDWFVLPNNFPKVLDGNYTDSIAEQQGKSKGSMIDEWVEKGLL